jgi:hypothetical protein
MADGQAHLGTSQAPPLGEGWDVSVLTDASGGVSIEAHQVAIQRMVAAGANMMTWMAVASEWQRDWARLETVGAITEVVKQHGGGSGIAYMWEQQLLNTPVPDNVRSAQQGLDK